MGFGQQRSEKKRGEERGQEEGEEERRRRRWQSCLFYFLVPGPGWQGLSLTDSKQEARTRVQGRENLGPFPSLLWFYLPLSPLC